MFHLWLQGAWKFTHVAPRCEWKGVSFSKNCERKGVGGLGVQPHTPVLFRTYCPPWACYSPDLISSDPSACLRSRCWFLVTGQSRDRRWRRGCERSTWETQSYWRVQHSGRPTAWNIIVIGMNEWNGDFVYLKFESLDWTLDSPSHPQCGPLPVLPGGVLRTRKPTGGLGVLF